VKEYNIFYFILSTYRWSWNYRWWDTLPPEGAVFDTWLGYTHQALGSTFASQAAPLYIAMIPASFRVFHGTGKWLNMKSLLNYQVQPWPWSLGSRSCTSHIVLFANVFQNSKYMTEFRAWQDILTTNLWSLSRPLITVTS
jgi:hypothetical protein